mmetsp:Transcript_24861/g.52052  ORF Transcript_24861/g.52052 Transcript_24861/m.52052 type:complete len:266 (+) Transcript_24861:253-1050(+)
MRTDRHDDYSMPSPATSNDASRSIMYHCRMQYLKSREGGLRGKQRRKSSFGLDVFEMAEKKETQQFSCLDEKVHGPCTPEILVPPSELMTRPHAFRQAYWRHHCKPTVRAIEKLEIHQLNERKERLNKKRKEILAKIRAKEKVRREKDIRRRAERVLNRHSNNVIESEESGDDSDSELEEHLGRMNLLSPSQLSRDSSPGRRKIIRSSIANDARRGRRTLVGNTGHGQMQKDALHAEDESAPENDAFSFLSDWGKQPGSAKKIRW